MLDRFYRAVLPEQGYFALFEGGRKRHVWCDSIDELTRETEARIDQQGLYFATSSFTASTTRTIANALHRRAFCFDIDAGPEKYAKHKDKVYETQRAAIEGLMAWSASSGIKPAWVVSSGAGLHVYILLDQPTTVSLWQPVAEALKAMALGQGLRIDPAVPADAARVLRPPTTLHHSGTRVAVLASGTRTYTLEQLRSLAGAYAPAAPVRRESANGIFLNREYPPSHLDKVLRNCEAMAYVARVKGDVSEPYWRLALGVAKFTVGGREACHSISEGHAQYDFSETEIKIDGWTTGPATCAKFADENSDACKACRLRGKITSPLQAGELNTDELAAEEAQHVEAPDLPAEVEDEPIPVTVTVQQVPLTAPSEPTEFNAFEDTDDAPAVAQKLPWDGALPLDYRIAATPTGYAMIASVIKMVDDPTDPSKKKAVTVEQQFTAVPFWFESWAAGTHDGDQAMATFCVFDKTRRVVTRYTLPTRSAAQRESLLVALASQNVQVYPSTQGNKQIMEDYVKASLEKIRSAGQRQKILDRFGTMYDDKDQLVVAQGKYLIQADGSVSEGVVNEALKSRANSYRIPLPDSTYGLWSQRDWVPHVTALAKEHIAYLDEFYSDPNFSQYQLAIMLAWASPMMAFMQGTYQPGSALPGIGLTVSLYSPLSGIGKTAALHAAALAFGTPAGLVLQLDRQSSTDFARQMMVLQCGTLPSFMDEMEDVEAKDLASLISAVGNGASRLRINGKTMQLTGGTPLAVVNMMSTNKSHRELAAADRSESPAVQMRLLEIDCSGVMPVTAKRSHAETEARSKLQRCAGAVGALIHLAICKLGPEKMNALGVKMAMAAREHVGGAQDGRILWRALGAVLAVRAILRQLGLDVFKDKALIEEFRRWHDESYSFSNDRLLPTSGEGLMSMLLSDIAGKTLITINETDMRKKDARYDVPLNDRVPDEVLARSVIEGGYCYLRTDALRDWAFKKRVSYRTIINRCRENGIIQVPHPEKSEKTTTFKIDLFKGTRMSQGVMSSVVRVDLTRLASMVDDAYSIATKSNVTSIYATRALTGRLLNPEQTAGAPRKPGPASG